MAESEQDAAQATLDKGEERGEQTVTVEDIGPARKSLTIEVPAERIAAKIEESYSQLQTDAQVPGFRRGRAPMRLLEKRFGSSVRDDVKGQLLSECYSQAIEEQDLMTADLSKPDLVTVYLLPGSNDKIQPLLAEQMKPGSRIVSHDFTFKGWTPDKEITVEDPSDEEIPIHKLYLYRR